MAAMQQAKGWGQPEDRREKVRWTFSPVRLRLRQRSLKGPSDIPVGLGTGRARPAGATLPRPPPAGRARPVRGPHGRGRVKPFTARATMVARLRVRFALGTYWITISSART